MHSRPLIFLAALLLLAAFILCAPRRFEHDSWQVSQDLVYFFSTSHSPPTFGPFPIFQYLTGLPLELAHHAGLPLTFLTYWTLLSQLAFFAIFLLLTPTFRHPGLLVAIIFLTSTFLPYAVSTFNELTAAFLTTAFLAAALSSKPRPALTAALFFLAALTKEPAVVPLLLIFAATRFLPAPPPPGRHITPLLLLASTLALATHAAFNLYRFHSPLNTRYLAQAGLLSHASWRIEYFLALLFSPNGGLVFFFPTFLLLLACLALQVFPPAKRSPSIPARPLLAAISFLVILLLAAASWYAPFGWWCWGPRLILPYLPAVLLYLRHAYPDCLDRLAHAVLRSRPRFYTTTILLLLLSLPHAAVALSPATIDRFFSRSIPEYPRTAGLPPDISQHLEFVHYAWRADPILLLRPLSILTNSQRSAPLALFSLSLILLLIHLRLSTPPPKIPQPPALTSQKSPETQPPTSSKTTASPPPSPRSPSPHPSSASCPIPTNPPTPDPRSAPVAASPHSATTPANSSTPCPQTPHASPPPSTQAPASVTDPPAPAAASKNSPPSPTAATPTCSADTAAATNTPSAHPHPEPPQTPPP